MTSGVGGGEDMEDQEIDPRVGKHLRVIVIIENQPGAGAKIAFQKSQRARPYG